MADQATPTLTQRERLALDDLAEYITLPERGPYRWKLVSMQALEILGLVQRIERNGLFFDWNLTEAGRRELANAP